MTLQVPTLDTLVEKRVIVQEPFVSTWILTVVPDLVGFKFPYRVTSTSEALGVCRKFMLKAELTAEAGEIKRDSNKDAANADARNFIVLRSLNQFREQLK